MLMATLEYIILIVLFIFIYKDTDLRGWQCWGEFSLFSELTANRDFLEENKSTVVLSIIQRSEAFSLGSEGDLILKGFFILRCILGSGTRYQAEEDKFEF